MRYFVIAALLALVILVMRQKPEKPADQEIPTSAAVAQSSAVKTTAQQHSWPKSALDRAQELKQQVKRERDSNADVLR